MSKWTSSKTNHFRRFQPKRIADLSSAYFCTYCSTGQIWFSTFVRKGHVRDIRIIKSLIFVMFWRLGTMLERFFKAKSFRLHISKPKKIPGNIFVWYFEGQKVVPQGPLGQNIDNLRIQDRMQIYEKNVPECFKSRFDRLER